MDDNSMSSLLNSVASMREVVNRSVVTSMMEPGTTRLENIAQLCGNLAPWASVVVFLAPFPTIQKIVQEKSVGNLPLLPYSSMICSTLLWSAYGFLKREARIWTANLFGLVLGVYFFTRFIQYSPKRAATLPGSVPQHLQFLLALTLATGSVTTMSSNTDEASSIIGMGAVLFAFAMFASPLSAVKVVLEKKSAKAIPLPFTIASMVNCILWTVFGIFKSHDVNVYLPCVLGLVSCIVQIALKVKYGDGPNERYQGIKMSKLVPSLPM